MDPQLFCSVVLQDDDDEEVHVVVVGSCRKPSVPARPGTRVTLSKEILSKKRKDRHESYILPYTRISGKYTANKRSSLCSSRINEHVTCVGVNEALLPYFFHPSIL